MLIALAAGVLLLQPPAIEQPPRLRTLLQNGSVCLVEPHFESPTIYIDLVASSCGAEDTPEHSGWRHLLEHLLVKGRDGKLDSKLEAVGGFLRAETYRDAMSVEIEVPPDQLDLGLSAVEELLREPVFSDDAIARETKVVDAELRLKSDEVRLADAGWAAYFGAAGLPPSGATDTIKKATAADLSELYLQHFQSGNLALVISGPVDLQSGTKAATHLLSRLPGTPNKAKFLPRIAKASKFPQASATGQAICASVPAYDSPEAAGSMAAMLAIAADQKDCFFLYTPSVRSAVMTLGSVTSDDLLEAKRKLEPNSLDYSFGRWLSKSWVHRQMSTLRQATFLRALLLAQSASASPERIEQGIDDLTPAQFQASARALTQALEVRGR